MAENPRFDRSRSPPLHAHTRGDNKAWSNFGAKMFLTTPVYVTPASWSAPVYVTFQNRSIAGPGPAAGPAGPAGPAVPAGPGPALEAAAAAPAGSDDDPGAGPNVPDEGAGPAGPAGRVEDPALAISLRLPVGPERNSDAQRFEPYAVCVCVLRLPQHNSDAKRLVP